MKILSFNRGLEDILSSKLSTANELKPEQAFPKSKSLFQPTGAAIRLHLDEVFNTNAEAWESENFLRPDIKMMSITTPEGYLKMFKRVRNFIDDYEPDSEEEAKKKQALSTVLNMMQDHQELFDTYRKALMQG